MNSMECRTVSELSSHFETRFEVLKTAFKLHVCAGKDIEELDEMKINLQDIQNILKQLRATVDQEKQDLQFAKKVLLSLRQERSRVEHMLAALPDRLPARAAPAAAALPAPPQPAQSAGTPAPAPAAGRAPPPPPSVAYLTVAEFAAVPQYMRGRGTRDQANRLLDQVNAALAARHALLRRPRSSLAGAEKKLWLACKREETADTKGKHFFTEDDFQRFNKTSVSKALRQLLVVLRHVGRIKTIRDPGTVDRHVVA